MALRTGAELHSSEHSAMKAGAKPEAWAWGRVGVALGGSDSSFMVESVIPEERDRHRVFSSHPFLSHGKTLLF